MDVFSPLGKYPDSVMSIQHRSVGPDLQGTAFARSKRGFQLAGREAAKLVELTCVQSALVMQEPEVR